jgi:hypothetical protein
MGDDAGRAQPAVNHRPTAAVAELDRVGARALPKPGGNRKEAEVGEAHQMGDELLCEAGCKERSSSLALSASKGEVSPRARTAASSASIAASRPRPDRGRFLTRFLTLCTGAGAQAGRVPQRHAVAARRPATNDWRYADLTWINAELRDGQSLAAPIRIASEARRSSDGDFASYQTLGTRVWRGPGGSLDRNLRCDSSPKSPPCQMMKRQSAMRSSSGGRSGRSDRLSWALGSGGTFVLVRVHKPKATRRALEAGVKQRTGK